ncbi:Proline-specific permease [Fulvia fulva]|uniref:Proline-specific permease n=1 Tax=Passalora fulva TaxID=5499 RepID=A0A9Q8USV1_PASFU|nr:Proline-specific permease [Fulvia fulva]KAK4617767.1 Proline-specific permease [Fulvia fulva]KAK4618706.1 Proline-specific permease [Fulvia fulva]UJO21176.1 Proline-specific permease [Fulvia fulva]WPV18674.1 Proline-specific permease [Fulvia fulva]WPV33511.1 Proline-specific permease [Fulvia fulva]
MATEIKAPTIDIATTPSDVQRGDVESCNRHAMQTEVKRDLQHTGLFLASGQAIATADPISALLGYIAMGLITWGVALMTGEISAFMPVTGGFVRHATKFVQPALGCATGWNFWYTMAITAPAELAAAATVINSWDASINQAVWYSVFIVVIMALSFSPVKAYGESEVFFAALKILLIVGLILAGIMVDLNRIGFRYWKEPGPFNSYLIPGDTGRFLGFWSTLISAACSHANVQVIALAGAETQNPRKIIPNAVRMTFWHIRVFYVLSIFVVGLLVPYNDPNLGISTGAAEQSPFVIAFQRAGIKVLPSIINAVVCTSAFSCGISCVFLASRTLYGLAEEGQAPRFFRKINRFGTPWLAVAASLIFMPLVYLSLGSSSSVVFGWFVNITTIAGLIGWAVICVTYLRFFYGLRYQGINRDRLPYKSPLQPYAAWITPLALCLVIMFSGYSVFFPGPWSTSSFLTYYIDIGIFICL